MLKASPNFDDEAEDIKPRIPQLSFVRDRWKQGSTSYQMVCAQRHE